MSTQPESLPRETGVEKSRLCPTCGSEMVVTESPYGSLSASCPTCDKAPEPQQAAAQPVARETGTDVTQETANG